MNHETELKYTFSHVGYVVEDIQKSLQRFMSANAKLIIPPAAETAQKVWVCLLEIEGNVKIEQGDILVAYTEERRKGEL